MERAFRGVWIPAEIYFDPRLTPTEIYLLAEIDSLDVGEGCDADNKYLSSFCKCDERSIRRFIAHLKVIGLITVVPTENGRRIYRIPNETPLTKEDKRQRFVPPTVEEVKAYCEERGNGIDAERFIDYYQARGWVIARGVKMIDWRACVRVWEKSPKDEKPKNVGQSDYLKHNYTKDQLQSKLINFEEWEKEQKF